MSEITGTWTSATINSEGSVTEMNGKTPVAWALIGTLNAQEGAYVDLTIKLDPRSFNGTNNLYHNTFSNSENGTVTTTAEHSFVRTLEGLTWKDDNADGEQDRNETKLSGVKVSLLKLREGTKFTTQTGQSDVWINFKNNMVGDLNANQLKKSALWQAGFRRVNRRSYSMESIMPDRMRYTP